MSESLISVSMNFSNGVGHTATTTSVVGAEDLDPSKGLGRVIGGTGRRVDFSNEQVQELLSNFEVTDYTTSRDANKTTITRKYMDRTSLLLKSHVVAVRGKDVGPSYTGNFDGLVFDYSECPNSPVQPIAAQGPSLSGGLITIGNIYNEVSETNEQTGEKVSLVYLNGALKSELSYNAGAASAWYQSNPDLSKSNLKYGYKLYELVSIMGTIGIPTSIGASFSSTVLFENSGTLESVLGSIASSLGMYFYVDPLSTAVKFISSLAASNIPILNPLELTDQSGIIDCSFSENYIRPVVVNTFKSVTAPIKADDGNKERVARFSNCDILGALELNIPSSTYELYYGAYCANALDARVFDAISYWSAVNNKPPKFGKFFPEFTIADSTVYKWKGLFQEFHENAKSAYNGPFDLENGRFIKTKLSNGKWNKKPSQTPAFTMIKEIFDILNNSVYISNKYSKRKARRMQWGSSDLTISGPYDVRTKMTEVEGLSKVAGTLKALGKDPANITINNFIQIADGVKGLGDYVFIGIKNQPNSTIPQDETDYEDFSESTLINYSDPFKRSFIAIAGEKYKKISQAVANSKTMWEARLSEDKLADTVRCPYTRTKNPVNDILGDRKAEKKQDDEDAGKNENDSAISDLFDKMNFVNASVKTNGSSGNPLEQATLSVKQGRGQETAALSAANQGALDKNLILRKSSRTLEGLVVPSFSIVIENLSYSLSPSGGITTTIDESTQKILPIDDQIIIGLDGQSYRTTPISRRFSAAQRNYLGL